MQRKKSIISGQKLTDQFRVESEKDMTNGIHMEPKTMHLKSPISQISTNFPSKISCLSHLFSSPQWGLPVESWVNIVA
jgi:hypothetical protein